MIELPASRPPSIEYKVIMLTSLRASHIAAPFICAFAAMSYAASADAECQFKVPTAIVCSDATNAARAYEVFGFDVEKTRTSSNRELLRQATCGAPYQAHYRDVKIKLLASGRVATPNGWVVVSDVSVEHEGIHDLFYTASAYIVGTCAKFIPNTDLAPHVSSPYLPTYPKDGYKVDTNRAMP